MADINPTNTNTTSNSNSNPKMNPSAMRGALKQKFGKLSEADLKEIDENPSVAADKIQSAYGYSKDKAAEEYESFKKAGK